MHVLVMRLYRPAGRRVQGLLRHYHFEGLALLLTTNSFVFQGIHGPCFANVMPFLADTSECFDSDFCDLVCCSNAAPRDDWTQFETTQSSLLSEVRSFWEMNDKVTSWHVPKYRMSPSQTWGPTHIFHARSVRVHRTRPLKGPVISYKAWYGWDSCKKQHLNLIHRS
jgi:hypothetical protein